MSIPYNMLTLAAGLAGTGKSTLLRYLIQAITTGAFLPYADKPVEPGNVVILSAEESISHTVRPHLEAIGADLSKIYIIESVIDPSSPLQERLPRLKEDLLELRQAVVLDIGNTRLIKIDPVTAYLGDRVNSNDNDQIRAALTPLAKLAAEIERCAIVLLAHLNKDIRNSDFISRLQGAGAFNQVVRSFIGLATHPHDDNACLLGNVKYNLIPKDERYCLKFTLETTEKMLEGKKGPYKHSCASVAFNPDKVTDLTMDDCLKALHDKAESPIKTDMTQATILKVMGDLTEPTIMDMVIKLCNPKLANDAKVKFNSAHKVYDKFRKCFLRTVEAGFIKEVPGARSRQFYIAGHGGDAEKAL